VSHESRSWVALIFSLLAMGFTAAIALDFFRNIGGVTKLVGTGGQVYTNALGIVTGQPQVVQPTQQGA
jgi:hypothetical protein